MRVNGKRVTPLLMAAVLVTASVASAFRVDTASAAQITNRTVVLEAGSTDSNLDGVTDGGSMAGGVVNHRFNFTIPTNGNLGSIQFLYCTTASGTCTTPTGLVTTSATLGDDDDTISGFSIENTTNGSPYLYRTAASTGAANVAVSYRLDTITNPTTVNQAFFIRISTFTSEDTTGSAVDTGTVAASTAEQIVLTGTMPESLIFCTGEAISTTNGIPDCTTATSGAIEFNQLFSPTDTATAVSQMAASTNATTGYTITVSGPTLTSGSNTIPAMSAADTSKKGFGQFGINLMANTTGASNPAVGADIAPVSNNADLKGQPATGYEVADTFKFASGDTIANSAAGGAGPTNAQIYTASYIVNVTGAQTAGTYTTTLTYVCTATF